MDMGNFLTKTAHKYLMEDCLDKFRRKHSLTEEECGRYRESDMRFDILSDMPEDALRQWDAYVAGNGYISFAGWTGIDNGYVPDTGDSDGMDGFVKEMESIRDDLGRVFNTVLGHLIEDDGSESEIGDTIQ
jgi:hypothetical protein